MSLPCYRQRGSEAGVFCVSRISPDGYLIHDELIKIHSDSFCTLSVSPTAGVVPPLAFISSGLYTELRSFSARPLRGQFLSLATMKSSADMIRLKNLETGEISVDRLAQNHCLQVGWWLY
ncbi:hypothetical protein J6590_026827 [Homalodisca vitripennis]|nr:hypothetical protein J6590_026827 [Homalodisca vitripennis]